MSVLKNLVIGKNVSPRVWAAAKVERRLVRQPGGPWLRWRACRAKLPSLAPAVGPMSVGGHADPTRRQTHLTAWSIIALVSPKVNRKCCRHG